MFASTTYGQPYQYCFYCAWTNVTGICRALIAQRQRCKSDTKRQRLTFQFVYTVCLWAASPAPFQRLSVLIQRINAILPDYYTTASSRKRTISSLFFFLRTVLFFFHGNSVLGSKIVGS